MIHPHWASVVCTAWIQSTGTPSSWKKCQHYKPFYWYFIHSGEYVAIFAKKALKNRRKLAQRVKKELENLFPPNILQIRQTLLSKYT
jgi:hypothetical protein